jgi:hypothetical protein
MYSRPYPTLIIENFKILKGQRMSLQVPPPDSKPQKLMDRELTPNSHDYMLLYYWGVGDVTTWQPTQKTSIFLLGLRVMLFFVGFFFV